MIQEFKNYFLMRLMIILTYKTVKYATLIKLINKITPFIIILNNIAYRIIIEVKFSHKKP